MINYNKVYFYILFKEILKRYKKYGAIWVIRGITKRILWEIAWFIMLPISAFGHLLGYRRLVIRIEHIGHLSVQPDTLLKEFKLGLIKKRKWFITAADNRVANQHLLSYWSAYFPIIRKVWKCYLLDALTRRYFMRDDLSKYDSTFFGAQPVYRINNLWGKRSAILTLSNNDISWGRDAFARLGIPEDKWYVCIHVREGGFIPNNEAIQSHRNSNIEKVIPAINEIVKRGGICVRMGDDTMKPLPEMEGVIDYAHHPFKSERMDVVLCAQAKFFLGCTSGLAFLSMIFGVPCAHANMIPVATLGIRYCDLSIPKLVWSEQMNRYLRFDELLGCPEGNFFFTHQYTDAGLIVEENSSEDILELVNEMFQRLGGGEMLSEDEKALLSNYLSLLTPNDYSHLAVSSIGIGFLKKHSGLSPQ